MRFEFSFSTMKPRRDCPFRTRHSLGNVFVVKTLQMKLEDPPVTRITNSTDALSNGTDGGESLGI